MLLFAPWTIDTPPPLGWHYASADRNPECLRFWNGSTWSVPVHESAPQADFAAGRATPDATTAKVLMWWRTPTPASLQRLAAEGVHCHA